MPTTGKLLPSRASRQGYRTLWSTSLPYLTANIFSARWKRRQPTSKKTSSFRARSSAALCSSALKRSHAINRDSKTARRSVGPPILGIAMREPDHSAMTIAVQHKVVKCLYRLPMAMNLNYLQARTRNNSIATPSLEFSRCKMTSVQL